MNKHFSLLYYYTLILLGFSLTSWIFYARFIRERVVKDIPMFLTEYRLIILCYICCMYLIVILSLLFSKAKEPNYIIKTLLEVLYTPLVTLDHLIKYNRFVKEYYYRFMYKFLVLLEKFNDKHLLLINMLFQIIPRIFLVIFLLVDTFYFHKLEILYKFILIGLIPFIHRYIKYSFKDLKDHYISYLESMYDEINMYDEAHSNPEFDWELTEDNKYHNEEISVKEYVEFRTKQILYGIPLTQYQATPMSSSERLRSYKKNNTINKEIKLTEKDYNIMRQEYYEMIPTLLKFNLFLEKYSQAGAQPMMKWFKIIIFGLYFISWSYILIRSYYHNPIELTYCKYYLMNILSYFPIMNDVFMPHSGKSFIPNFIVIENIKWLMYFIYNIIKTRL